MELEIDPQTPLLWVLRSNVGLTGIKFGCDTACTVHVNGNGRVLHPFDSDNDDPIAGTPAVRNLSAKSRTLPLSKHLLAAFL